MGDALFINLAVYVCIKFIEVGAEFGGNLGDSIHSLWYPPINFLTLG